jgi:putative lipoic acid-binding regulatory protein
MPDTESTTRPNIEPGSEAPKIVFPCDYPIKVMGVAGAELHTLVKTVMVKHAPGFDEAHITIRDSAQGNYQSLTVTITATGEAQLRTIHAELKQSPQVKLVL